MASVSLKPQYGPTLGTLLAPRWHAATPTERGIVRVLAAGLVLLAIAVVLTLLPPTYSGGGAAPFHFSYRGLYRTAPGPGEYVRTERRSGGRLEDSFAVSPLRLPRYKGGLSGEFPVYASGFIEGLSKRFSDFRLRGEGKTRVHTVPAYNIFYQVTVEGREMYGRDVLLLPERSAARDGVALEMLQSPGIKVKSPQEIGKSGALEKIVESFTIA